jgi:hypothetical protein
MRHLNQSVPAVSESYEVNWYFFGLAITVSTKTLYFVSLGFKKFNVRAVSFFLSPSQPLCIWLSCFVTRLEDVIQIAGDARRFQEPMPYNFCTLPLYVAVKHIMEYSVPQMLQKSLFFLNMFLKIIRIYYYYYYYYYYSVQPHTYI